MGPVKIKLEEVKNVADHFCLHEYGDKGYISEQYTFLWSEIIQKLFRAHLALLWFMASCLILKKLSSWEGIDRLKGRCSYVQLLLIISLFPTRFVWKEQHSTCVRIALQSLQEGSGASFWAATVGLAIHPSPQTAMEKSVELSPKESGIKSAASEQQQCHWKDRIDNRVYI